jgi:hypothetical protein
MLPNDKNEEYEKMRVFSCSFPYPTMKYAIPQPVPARAAITIAIRSFFIEIGRSCTDIQTNINADRYRSRTLKDMTQRLWFAAKRYGYGWYPITWEGWAVTLAYIIGVTLPIPLLPQSGEQRVLSVSIAYVLWAACLTILLIWICVKKGEKARWRWGK